VHQMDQPIRLSSALADRYAIERELGAGGMATVYLAHDVKHDRKVALKVLKPELAAVLGAERFVVEIKTTAGLQHPHILPLFDSGSADGFLYYVMPYIEGETLRDKLNRETQLDIEEAVTITTEVADALDYAHRHGVIHRDIKPENILLHDGRPMVADFGIALAVSAAAGGRMTETGLSLGTPHYMSPEQATAEKDLTARSDIYSLGSVLYEMLTGNPPHVGASAQQIIMRIVTEEAEPVTTLRKTVPPNVAAAVAKALEKLPADRFASAKALAEALQNRSFTTAKTAAAARTPLPPPYSRTALPAALVAAAILLALAVWGWLRPVPEEVLVGRFEIPLPALSVAIGGIAASPDGRYIIYQGESAELVLRPRDQRDPQLMASGQSGWSPFFSPDGASVGYLTGFPGSLVTIAVGGTTPRVIVADSTSGYGGAWGESGAIYYTSARGFLMRVPATGGTPEVLVRPDTTQGHQRLVTPDLLPGENAALVTVFGAGPSQVGVVDLKTGTTRVLSAGTIARFGPPDYMLVGRETGELVAVPFDPVRGVVTGPEVVLSDRVRVGWSGYTTSLAVARNGELFYLAAGATAATIVRIDREGREEPVDPGWTELLSGIALSPDGTRLAISKFAGGRDEVWLKTLDRGPLSRLSSGGTLSYRPSWTPDGRAIIFVSDREHPAGVYRISATGGGEAERIYGAGAPIDEAEFSRDGRWLVYRAGSGGGRDVYAVRWGADEPPIPVATTEFEERAPAFSPDARFVAYVSDESGRPEVYVRPFPDVSAAKWLVSTQGGLEPRWAPDGRELFYRSLRSAGGNLVAARLALGRDFAVQEERVLFSTREHHPEGMHHMYDVLPDGSGFLFARIEGEAGARIVVLQNWRMAVEQARGRR